MNINDTITEKSIVNLFKIILNREPERSAIDYYLKKDQTINQFAVELFRSNEFIVHNKRRLGGFNGFSILSKVDFLKRTCRFNLSDIDEKLPDDGTDGLFVSDLFKKLKGVNLNGVYEFNQNELVINRGVDTVVNVLYRCFVALLNIDRSKPFLVICIKDFPDLLEYTLNNLVKYRAKEYTNILVIDDRSTKNIKDVTDKFDVSYIRIDNDKGYNYSTMMNLASAIAYNYDSREIIFWNSDMWIQDSEFFENIFSLHRKNESTLSGMKLVYPDFAWREDYKIDKNKAGLVQFGGPIILVGESIVAFGHACIFENKNGRANRNSRELFVTGAFCLMDLQWLVESGGFNHSLSKCYNDVDICIRIARDKKSIFYFGKDIFLYHAESLVLEANNKFDDQLRSDQILFARLCGPSVIGKLLDDLKNV